MKPYLLAALLLTACGNQQIYTSTSSWFIDATISATTNNMDQTNRPNAWVQANGTSDAYMELQDGSAKASIGCSQDGFQSSGLTCPSNEGIGEIGMTIQPDKTDLYNACIEASFEFGVGNDPNSPNGGQVDAAIMVVQTGNTDHTPRDLDGPVNAWSQRIVHGDAATMSSLPQTVCRVFSFNAGEMVTLRLFYNQITGGEVHFTEIVAGGRWAKSIHLTVRHL